jgi:two-component system phosphate regulon sensor histidine kinase PhoR
LLADGDSGELKPEQSAMLATVQRNLQRIAAIVDDLLALSVTDREATPRTDLVDLGEVVNTVVNGISLQASERRLRLEYVNELGGVLANGDSSRLDRAIANLLSNALKFTPAGGTVSMRATSDGTTATIEVSDTGMGIPAEDVDRIFDQYFRSSAARDQIAGTGLGLAIVHAVAEQHGGDVCVRSEIGKGTTITLRLPVAAAG